MTFNERLEEIEKRLKAATPGPWQWANWNNDLDYNPYNQRTLESPPNTRPDGPSEMFPDLPNCILSCEDPIERNEDKELIAAAPTDLAYLLKSARVMREALATIQTHSGKTRLADCCVEKSCTAHCVDGELVSNCAYQSGVFDGYATTAQIAEEALAELDKGDMG